VPIAATLGLVLGALLLAAFAGRLAGWKRAAALGIAVAVVLGASARVNPADADFARYQAGYYLCLVPAVIPMIAALFVRTPLGRSRWTPPVLATALALTAASTWSSRTRVATDAIESTRAAEWRGLEWGTRMVVTLDRADGAVVRLPLFPLDRFGADPQRTLRVQALSPDDVGTSAPAGPFLYYRSSLCATAPGRDACRRLEAELDLQSPPVYEARLPPIPSQSWHPLESSAPPEPSIRVALFVARAR
jgi:hypothetical protein